MLTNIVSALFNITKITLIALTDDLKFIYGFQKLLEVL